MNLLITTQKVDMNDDVLGFFHGWITEFAKNYDKVTVICLEEGKHSLPSNVKVLSLGKEKTSKKSQVHKVKSQLTYILKFYKYIWQERYNYDQVFVHMNPEYVALGGLFWRLTGKKVALWYVHKNVDFKLKIAEKLTQTIFTASKESFQLESKKVNIVGHGIDTSKFVCDNKNKEEEFDIVYVGRLSGIKNQKLLLEAVDVIVNEFGRKEIKIGLIGWFMVDKDESYYNELKEFTEEKKITNNVVFVGSKPNNEIVKYYCNSKISVNLAPTGGMDKVVLESLLCNTPAVVFNKTFKDLLSENNLILEKEDAVELANRIVSLIDLMGTEDGKEIVKTLRDKVVQNYSLSNLIKKIKNIL